jgi:hypothetical protein
LGILVDSGLAMALRACGRIRLAIESDENLGEHFIAAEHFLRNDSLAQPVDASMALSNRDMAVSRVMVYNNKTSKRVKILGFLPSFASAYRLVIRQSKATRKSTIEP